MLGASANLDSRARFFSGDRFWDSTNLSSGLFCWIGSIDSIGLIDFIILLVWVVWVYVLRTFYLAHRALSATSFILQYVRNDIHERT